MGYVAFCVVCFLAGYKFGDKVMALVKGLPSFVGSVAKTVVAKVKGS